MPFFTTDKMLTAGGGGDLLGSAQGVGLEEADHFAPAFGEPFPFLLGVFTSLAMESFGGAHSVSVSMTWVIPKVRVEVNPFWVCPVGWWRASRNGYRFPSPASTIGNVGT